MVSARVVLLGPQRHNPTLKDAVDSLGIHGRVAAVTAGWEERENEDQELRDHLGLRVVNLAVHERAEEVFKRDPELFAAMRERFDHLRRLQELYRVRLSHALAAGRELLAREAHGGFEALMEEVIGDALEAVRELDRRHLAQIEALHARFDERWRPLERDSVRRHRLELARELEGCEVLCVAGGHVTILLNRMRLFGLLELARGLPIIAWSAGAMVLSPRVVVFHDSPPQGGGSPEVLEQGLGAFSGLIALPHADKRLKLDDPARVALFARRFGPDWCALLVKGARLDWDGQSWSAAEGTLRMEIDGTLVQAGASGVSA
jgi:hypothetical protein